MVKIVFIHSLNNYTGSPNVLSVIIKGFIAKGYEAELITSRGEGFLSNITGLHYRYTCYQWLSSKGATALLLLLSQVQVFFMLLFSSKRNTLYYINTITPAGAAWACRFTGKKYIYHVHENMQMAKPVYRLFRSTYRHCNKTSIFVSEYLKKTAVNCKKGTVVYNALSPDFISKAREYLNQNTDEKINLLMVSSLRRFKGIYEFVELAKNNPEFTFELVLSASETEVATFAKEAQTPANLTVYPAQNNMHAFYMRARLLLQLSHPEAWVETFGLTILEAMVYGVPAIVPNVGGPTELVENGKSGYCVDTHNLDDINSKIRNLMTDDEQYKSFSYNALEKSKQFSEEKMQRQIEKILIDLEK